MEDTNKYQIPPRFNGAVEEREFWAKVVADQVASGIGAEKFCGRHQVNFTKFHYWKYSKIRPDCIATNKRSNPKKQSKSKDITKFVSLELASDKNFINHQTKNRIDEQKIKVIEIVFKNGHKIIWPSVSDANLLLLIKTVGGL